MSKKGKSDDMKKILLFIICAISLLLSSCNYKGGAENELSHRDSLLFNQLNIFQSQLREDQFKLYRTKNIYTFLELNTVTGQIWIIQWSLEDNKRFSYVLDDNSRITKEDEPICGRFSLHPTENIYNFILLDNIDGRCWQVQWSFDEDKRLVLPID